MDNCWVDTNRQVLPEDLCTDCLVCCYVKSLQLRRKGGGFLGVSHHCKCSICGKEWHYCVSCAYKRLASSLRDDFRTNRHCSLKYIRRHLREHEPKRAKPPPAAIDQPSDEPNQHQNGTPDSLSDDFPTGAISDTEDAMDIEVQSPSNEDAVLVDEHATPTAIAAFSDALREYILVAANLVPDSYLWAAVLPVLTSNKQDPEPSFPWKKSKEQATKRLATYLKIGIIANALGMNDKATFASILKDFLEESPKGPVSDIFIPHTVEQFSQHYLNRTNSKSLVRTLPTPDTFVARGSSLSMISIADALGFALAIPPVKSDLDVNNDRYKSLFSSQRFQHVVKRLVPPNDVCGQKRQKVVVLANIWSDGWDPNRLSKSNRGSVWTATACFVVGRVKLDPSGKLKSPPKVIAVVNQVMCCGTEKEDHEVFFERLRQELQSDHINEEGWFLPSIMFSRAAETDKELGWVTAYVAPCALLQDNPERRKSSGLLAGNSNLHAMFGVSCHFGKLRLPFAACESCVARTRQYVRTAVYSEQFTQSCQQCLCWEVGDMSSRTEYDKPISDIPLLSERDPGYWRQKRAGRITFDDMKKALRHARMMYCDRRDWSEATVKEYLGLHCLDKAHVARFMVCAKRQLVLQELDVPGSPMWEDEQHRLDTIAHVEANPMEYEMPSPPAIWSMFGIDDLAEAPMHLAQNCQKALLRTAIKYCSTFGRKAELIRRFSDLLEKVKALHLLHIRAMGFKDDNFGGFVAENYAAVAMLLPWLSSVLEMSCMAPAEEKAPVAVPDPKVKKYKDWTMDENRKWMSLRKIKPISGGNAQDLKEQVQKCISENPELEIPVPEPEPGGPRPRCPRDEPPATLRSLLLSGHKLFKVMFAKDLSGEAGRNRMKSHAVLFLSLWEDVDKITVLERTKPVAIAKYNTLGLMRGGEAFCRFSNLRNLHEGGGMGEGVVKTLRRMCPAVARTRWSKNLMDAFYHKNVTDSFLVDLEQPIEEVVAKEDLQEEADPDSVVEDEEQMELLLSDRTLYRRVKAWGDKGKPTPDHPRNLLKKRKPFSVTFYRSTLDDTVSLGVVSESGTIPIIVHPDDLVDDDYGFKYFRVDASMQATPHIDESSLSCKGMKVFDHGIALPYLLWRERADVVGVRRCAFLTNDWMWFDGRTFH